MASVKLSNPQTAVADLLAAFTGQVYPVNLLVANCTKNQDLLPVVGGIIDPAPGYTGIVITLSSVNDLTRLGYNVKRLCAFIDGNQGFVVENTSNPVSSFSYEWKQGVALYGDKFSSELEAPSAAAFGVGPLWIAGAQYWCDGVRLSKKKNIVNSLFRITPTTGALTTLNTNSTWTTKTQLPCSSFQSVRIGLINHTAAPVTGVKACVAQTETADFGTLANQQQPVVGGVAYNTLDSVSEQYGWRSLLFAGVSSTVTPVTLTAADTSVTGPVITWSDWCDLSSVPRADGGSNALLLLRVYYPGATNAYSIAVVTAASQTSSAANRGNILQTTWHSGADDIATITGATAGLYANGSISFVVEFSSSDRVITVANIGDSTFEGQSSLADKYSNWLIRACGDASGNGTYYSPAVMAVSGITQEQYWVTCQKYMSNTKPNIAIFEAWSPNQPPNMSNAATARYKNQVAKGRVMTFLRYCAANKIVPILTTALPNNYAQSIDGERKNFNSWIRSLSNDVIIADYDLLISDGATPAKIATAYRYDDTHPNEAGHEAFSAIMVSAIKLASVMVA